MSDFKGWKKVIDNIPVSCTYCRKKWDKDKIQYIQLLGSRREPVCNKECAIGLAKSWIDQYRGNISDLTKRIKELEDTKK